VHAVPAVPRTLSGKKLEVPVKRILLGQQAEDVASKDALVDPTALDPYRHLATNR
jgi:acetoacetyl-CoA synthetase